MKKTLLLLVVLSVGAIEASKLRCVCNDSSIIMPECGICGVELGTMKKNESETGVECICINKLKLKEIPCAEVCKLHRGWSGKMK